MLVTVGMTLPGVDVAAVTVAVSFGFQNLVSMVSVLAIAEAVVAEDACDVAAAVLAEVSLFF